MEGRDYITGLCIRATSDSHHSSECGQNVMRERAEVMFSVYVTFLKVQAGSLQTRAFLKEGYSKILRVFSAFSQRKAAFDGKCSIRR